MDKTHKDVLQITKEIVVKFVEVGRITPANFAESFPAVYAVVLETLTGNRDGAGPETPPSQDASGFLLADSENPGGPSDNS